MLLMDLYLSIKVIAYAFLMKCFSQPKINMHLKNTYLGQFNTLLTIPTWAQLLSKQILSLPVYLHHQV